MARQLAPVRAVPDARGLVLALVAFALLARLASALLVPPWQGPDEPKHFEYARLLVDQRAQLWSERRLLGPADASPALQGQIIASLAEYHYWEHVSWLPSGPQTPAPLPANFAAIWPQGTHTQLHRPSLYYYLGALVLLPVADQPLEVQLLALRFLSALLGALTVLVAWAAARAAFPDDPFLPLVTAAFVAALPMHVFIAGTANNDNLVALLGALVALGLARALRGGGARQWLLILGALALALATKRTAVGMAPALALAACLGLATLRRRLVLPAALGLGLGATGLGALALWPPAGLPEALSAYALNGAHQWQGLLRIPWGVPETGALLLRQLAALFASFWGLFGWFNLLLPLPWYLLFAALSGLCLVGFLYWFASRLVERSPLARAQLATAAVCLVAVVGMVALALAERLPYLSPHELPQGRYLFVVLVPIALVHAVGAGALLPRRPSTRWLAARLVALGLVLLDLVVYAGYVVPFYRWPVG
ncbi:MAG: glycosyltransferase family 39 protein [Chloroflexota bacterium]